MKLSYLFSILVFGALVWLLSSCQDTTSKVAGAPPMAAGQQIEAYLKANSLTGEQTTSTGLVYIIEAAGGEEKPVVKDQITIHYKGYLTDGTVFDQTKGSPRTFGLYQLIKAWQEAIPMIGRGGKIKILAPPSTAYGNNPPRGTGITPESVLVFDIELVDF
ncbi:MAG: FKBP-type peptidyl-prolyl cis-trans isomerase [Saprospiraceae bacterium]